MTNMREKIEELFKKYIRLYLLMEREHLDISQEKMAEKLEMSRRGYAKLEHGESCCNTITFVLIILIIADDPYKFIDKLRSELFRIYETIDA